MTSLLDPRGQPLRAATPMPPAEEAPPAVPLTPEKREVPKATPEERKWARGLVDRMRRQRDEMEKAAAAALVTAARAKGDPIQEKRAEQIVGAALNNLALLNGVVGAAEGALRRVR